VTAAHITVNSKNLDKFLACKCTTYGIAHKETRNRPHGLAWTEVRRRAPSPSSVKLPGKGTRSTTARAKWMQEIDQGRRSPWFARAAKRPRRQRGLSGRPRPAIHLPEWATPKRPVRRHRHRDVDHARCSPASRCAATWLITGEITLARQVAADRRPEEAAAAHPWRGGIKVVLIRRKNVKDLQEIPEEVKNSIDIVSGPRSR